MRLFVIIALVIMTGVSMPKPAQPPKGSNKPRFVNYANKPAPKGAKVHKEKAKPMSNAMHGLLEGLDDWQYAGPLPYDPIYNGTKDPYPMPEFDKRIKAND